MTNDEKKLSLELAKDIADLIHEKMHSLTLMQSDNPCNIVMAALSSALLAHNQLIIHDDEQHKIFDWFKKREKEFYAELKNK